MRVAAFAVGVLVLAALLGVVPGALPSTSAAAPVPSAVPATGRTWVVAVDGSDDAPGTAQDPYRTVARALRSTGAGDTILVRPGRHAGFDIAVAGRPGAPVSIVGGPGGDVVIDGRLDGRRDTVHLLPTAGDVVLDGLTVTGSSGNRSSGILVEGVTRGPVTVVRSRLTGNDGFGILVLDSRDVTIEDSEIDHDRTGVEVNGDGAGVVVRGNRIHHQDRLIRATPRSVNANDDYGATGVSLVRTGGPVLVEGNQVWANRAPSDDYGWDGSAFEIFSASGVTIRDNRAWDNEAVLETGTANGMPCAGNSFVRNIGWGAASAGRARGVILRCGEGMLVASDTLVDLDDYALMVGANSPVFSGSIAGARIANDLLVLADASGAPLIVTSPLPADLSIDHVLLWNDPGAIADVWGTGRTTDLAQLQAWTGQARSSLQAAPRFVHRRGNDYRLRPGSPAIDAGAVIPGATDTWMGQAPDMGALEAPDMGATEATAGAQAP